MRLAFRTSKDLNFLPSSFLLYWDKILTKAPNPFQIQKSCWFRIPKEFPKNSQRIPKEFPKNSQRIPKRIPKEFSKNSPKILKNFFKKFPQNHKKIHNRNYLNENLSSCNANQGWAGYFRTLWDDCYCITPHFLPYVFYKAVEGLGKI